MPEFSETSSRSESASVTSRLISSGMLRSKLRNPASTCTTGICRLAAASEQARVLFTSPKTTTALGGFSCSNSSKRSRMRAVWMLCVPEPTSRLISGSGIFSTSKKDCDMA